MTTENDIRVRPSHAPCRRISLFIVSDSTPSLSVVIATRDRPALLRSCVASVLVNDHNSFEVIVVEQGERRTELPDDPRLIHIHSTTLGKSAGLNIGLTATRAPILAFTDDDCIVPTDWLRNGEALFAEHPDVSMAFGTLLAMEHDPATVFVPAAEFPRFRIVADSRSAHVRGGAGANMFARRSMFDTIGGYDEQIGPGARFRACEEYDVYFRALAAGLAVAFAPDCHVVHVGARPYADGQGQMLQRWYAYGEGAVVAKHLKLRDGMARPARHILRDDVHGILESLRQHRLSGVGQLAYKLRGLIAGLASHVDQRKHVFATTGQSTSP